jgi:hypothetical protein
METYDIVFTYGLLEHYKPAEVGKIMGRCSYLMKPGGVTIHYVVPQKLTNSGENNDVPRYKIHRWIGIGHELLWVYPVLKNLEWKTNRFFGKGFFIWETK